MTSRFINQGFQMAFRFAVPVLLAALSPSLPAAAQTAGAPAETVVVLDASGSMWGRIDGRPKIEIAREATRTLFEGFPAQARIGLVAYGHRRTASGHDPPGHAVTESQRLGHMGAADGVAAGQVGDGPGPRAASAHGRARTGASAWPRSPAAPRPPLRAGA